MNLHDLHHFTWTHALRTLPQHIRCINRCEPCQIKVARGPNLKIHLNEWTTVKSQILWASMLIPSVILNFSICILFPS